jgi:hypothetical protein
MTKVRGTTQAFDGANLGPLIDKLLLLQELQPLLKLFFTLFKILIPPPPVAIPPAPGPVDPGRPGGPSLPQTPIDTRPTRVLSGAALSCAGMEKPKRVGGGPGVNYSDHLGMIERKENFNYDCVGIFYGSGRDANGDELFGEDIIAADIEFRNTYRVYFNGRLTALVEGKGDDNPVGEGKPAPWHEVKSEHVTIGSSRWLGSAGCDNRIVFHAQGVYEVEFEYHGYVAGRIEIHVS